MAKPPQQAPDSVQGIFNMLGAGGMGMPQGGGNPGLGGPRMQRTPGQYTDFQSWLSGIYGQIQPPPDALADLYARYQQEAGQWAGQGGVGDRIQNLLLGQQWQQANRQRPGDQGRIGTSRGRG